MDPGWSFEKGLIGFKLIIPTDMYTDSTNVAKQN